MDCPSCYTSIEQIFHYELFIIKLCGGFLFNWSSTTRSIIYRVLVIFLTRVLLARQTATPIHVELSTLAKISSQNQKIFLISHTIISHLTVLVTLLTGIRYHKIMLVILRKQLDKRYLHMGYTRWRDAINLLNDSTTLLIHSSPALKRGKRKENWWLHLIKGRNRSVESNNQNKVRGRTARIDLVKNFIIANILFIAFSSYIKEYSYFPNFSLKKSSQPTSWSYSNSTNNNNSNNNSKTPATTINFQPETTNLSLSVATTKSNGTILGNNVTTWILSTSMKNQNYLKISLLSITYAVKHSSIILFHIIQAALTLNQTYGQLFVVFMITAAITDMIDYSCNHDNLVHEPNHSNKYKILNHNQQLTNRHRRRPLLTTELLVQVRDVLVTIRCITSLDYLIIQIFDLARLMRVFWMFNAAFSLGKLESVVFVLLDYIGIVFTITLTRLGYHWLHSRVRELKRVVDEKNFLLDPNSKSQSSNININNNNNNDDDVFNVDINGEGSDISEAERITTNRLSDHIDNLWPTDWFTPDLKSYLKHNIFVITFVATLQQLVEASSNLGYNQSKNTKIAQAG